MRFMLFPVTGFSHALTIVFKANYSVKISSNITQILYHLQATVKDFNAKKITEFFFFNDRQLDNFYKEKIRSNENIMSLPKNLQDCYFYYYSVCRKVRHAFDISISDFHRITDSKKWLFIGNKLSISSRASSFGPWTCLLEMDWEPMFPSKLPRSSHGYWKSTVTHTKFYLLIDLNIVLKIY